MIETGLIIAQVIFLALLYLFVWSVVRSSSRQIDAPPPVPVAAAPRKEPPPPARRRSERRGRATMTAPVPAAPAAPAPRASPDTAETPGAEAAHAGAEAPPASGVRQRERARAAEAAPLDLGANLTPKLVVERSPSLAPGQEVSLDRGLTIGRSSSSGIAITDPFVSHMHARIVRRGPFLFVEDLGSTNGTFLNDRRVDSDAQLKMRDQLRIGETVLRYEE